jgi:hypothetical protein
MKRYPIPALVILLVLLSLIQACDPTQINPTRLDNPTVINPVIKPPQILVPIDSSEEGELVVIYKNLTPRAKEETYKKISNRIPGAQPVRLCRECDSNMELWTGSLGAIIEFLIQEPAKVRAGSESTTGTVGEDSQAFYSRNIKNFLPHDRSSKNFDLKINTDVTTSKGENVISVAILDTGNKVEFMDSTHFGITEIGKKVALCHPDGAYGWNFITDSSDIKDDHINLHGTLVNQYIINQFVSSPENSVKIMNLKTHNADGVGKLFDIICAIHYAKNRGANIINASWGSEGVRHPYMDSLITVVLKKQGILFFAAAGNNTPAANRNVDINRFYPAILSDISNNVITVTTTDGKRVSPWQNFSANHVDIGVVADGVTANDIMEFREPFGSGQTISGSSFATPIAAGKFGAFLPKSIYSRLPSMTKEEIINELSPMPAPLVPTVNTSIIHVSKSLSRSIRKGRYMLKKNKYGRVF